MKEGEDEEANDCMLSFIAQMDPKGWIWSNLGYRRQFLKEVRISFIITFYSLADGIIFSVHAASPGCTRCY